LTDTKENHLKTHIEKDEKLKKHEEMLIKKTASMKAHLKEKL
jgi:hypothetical protein